MLYIYPYTNNAIDSIEEDRIEITEEDYQLLLEGRKIWTEDGQLIVNEKYEENIAKYEREQLIRPQVIEKEAEINQLKQELKDTDYKTLKFMEGQLTQEEFNASNIERANKRARINELEAEIQTLLNS